MATLTLTLRDDVVAKVREQASSRKVSVEAVIEDLVRSLDASPVIKLDNLETRPSDSVEPGVLKRQREAMERHRAFIAAHQIEYPPGFQVDDSRETIYGGPDGRGA